MEATEFKTKAQEFYNQSNPFIKIILYAIFGKEAFEDSEPAHVKLFLEACKSQNLDPLTTLRYAYPANSDEECENATKALQVIIKYKNKGKIFDYKNANEYKWFPRFNMNPGDGSGFAFSSAYTTCANTFATVGPRLSYVSEQLCKETVPICLPYYKSMFNQ